MVIKQHNSQVLRFAFLNAFFATFGLALGSTISGFFHKDYQKIFAAEEYAVLYLLCFLLAFFVTWVTTRKEFEVEVNEQGLKVSDQNSSDSLTWDDIVSIKRPSLFMSRWVFTSKQGKKIKLAVNTFNSQQQTDLTTEINHRIAS
ncbi:MAG: hypothetical protein PVJ72_15990 [Gammaproteobacteria bacterium]|jgi:hypothetical protein